MKNSTNELIKTVYEPHWIDYPASNSIIKQMNQLLEFQEDHRPENLLIISESNNGKTIIAKRFLGRNQPKVILDGNSDQTVVLDVLMIQCPYVADEKLLYYSILDELNIPYRSSKHKQELLTLVLDAFKRLQLKILILDELQHLLSKPSKQRDMLNLLKYISNEVGLSIIGVGTLEAFYVINSDEQLANRFNRTVLPKWKYDNNFLSLLLTYQEFIQQNVECNLVEPDISKIIYDLGEGLLGEYIRILKLLWKESIEDGSKMIDINTINRINYTSPSQRRDPDLLNDF